MDDVAGNLCTFSSDSSSQLDILGHDGDTLSVDGAQVGVFEETHQVGLRGLLQSSNGCTLETEVSLEVLSDFSHKTLERQFPDQQLGRLLVSSDFSQGYSSRPVTMRLLDTSSRWGRLSGGFRCQLLSRCFSSSGLSSGLLGSGHLECLLLCVSIPSPNCVLQRQERRSSDVS